MSLWPHEGPEPVDRWGAVFLVAGLVFDLLSRSGVEVSGFTVRALTLLAACFLGPALVRLAEHFSRRQWSGIMLGAVTFAACAAVTVILRFLVRDYL